MDFKKREIKLVKLNFDFTMKFIPSILEPWRITPYDIFWSYGRSNLAVLLVYLFAYVGSHTNRCRM